MSVPTEPDPTLQRLRYRFTSADHIIASLVFPKIEPTTGLAYRSSLFTKLAANGTMRSYNISFDAKNSSIMPSDLSIVDGNSGVSDTRISTWAVPAKGEPEQLLLFYQRSGDDITMKSGSVSTGVWTEGTIPVPNE